ncbi:GNAT family N-acetyltransferase [Sphingomonas sp. RT2P30]|uniref:GNAT family N-acetyltransferase n=1 Tax=Parasphingomonas halimpatiens TaxID=3096162 RepID=UPI002FCB56CE
MPTEADPALVAIWAQGWALTREVAPPVAIPGGWRIEVGLPDQRRRFVYPHAGDAVAVRAKAIDQPFEFIKVASSDDKVRPLLGAAWAIGPPGYMMTSAPVDTVPFDHAPAYRIVLESVVDHVTVATILSAAGELAATGRVGLVGDVAIYDRIRVQDAHQRRGLGRGLMMALGGIANRAGVSRWVLVAPPEGRALYETLGWTVHVPYTTAFIPPV